MAELLELYWDLIAVVEARFAVVPSEVEEERFYRRFQAHVVRRVGRRITCTARGRACAEDKYPDFQQIGDMYGAVGDEQGVHLYKWVQSSRRLLVLMDERAAGRVDLKRWLVMMMELVDGARMLRGCQALQVYVSREDLVNVKDLLKNLNWIGGELVQNVGDRWSDDEAMVWSDERYVVIRFDC